MSTPKEKKGRRYLHVASGEIFTSLRTLPVVDPDCDEKPIELMNERHMRRCNHKEFNEQFVKL